MIRICLLGPGRTGMIVIEHLIKSGDFELVSVIAKPGSMKTNHQLNEILTNGNDLVVKDAGSLAEEVAAKNIQVAIDFTTPKAALRNARVLAEKGVNLVIGTTGFSRLQFNELSNLVRLNKIGLVYAPNISVGINALLFIIKTLAKMIPQYDVEISEYHHRNKKDAPSGTALKIARAVSKVKEEQKPFLVFGRKGEITRKDNEIGIHTIRAGGIIGVHKVLFSGCFDEIEVTHRSYSRSAFAEGALKAAKFIVNRQGFYNMEDVLTIDSKDLLSPVRSKLQTISDKGLYWWKFIFNRSRLSSPIQQRVAEK